MDQALQTWTDDNTGGLLKEYTERHGDRTGYRV